MSAIAPILGRCGPLTIITSAPYAARQRPATGPARMRVRSSTRRPASGRASPGAAGQRSGAAKAGEGKSANPPVLPPALPPARPPANPPALPPALACNAASARPCTASSAPPMGVMLTTGCPASACACGCASHCAKLRTAATTRPASAAACSKVSAGQLPSAVVTAARSVAGPEGRPSSRSAPSRWWAKLACRRTKPGWPTAAPQAYRPGALAGQGFGAPALAARRPGIVVASLSMEKCAVHSNAAWVRSTDKRWRRLAPSPPG